jgi:glycosyltransferase involved in cell wall biosynthesis
MTNPREQGTRWAARTPLVSICIPAYKADKYIESTLRSIAAQTFTDWEVIVTEDGSSDRTREIVHSFAATIRQSVTYNRHEVNRGLPATRNTGIAAARGVWVALLDSDDLWRPNHLESLVEASRQNSCDLVFSGTEWFEDGTGKTLRTSVASPEDLKQLPVALFTGRLSVLPSSVMIRRQIFHRIGFVSTEFPLVNDTEYWLRVLRHGGKMAYSGKITCLYRKHGDAMSSKSAEMLADSALLCEKYANWSAIPRALRKQRPADLYRWAGRTLMPVNPAQASKLLQRSLRLEPFNPKTLGLLARSILHFRRSAAVPATTTLAQRSSVPTS